MTSLQSQLACSFQLAAFSRSCLLMLGCCCWLGCAQTTSKSKPESSTPIVTTSTVPLSKAPGTASAPTVAPHNPIAARPVQSIAAPSLGTGNTLRQATAPNQATASGQQATPVKLVQYQQPSPNNPWALQRDQSVQQTSGGTVLERAVRTARQPQSEDLTPPVADPNRQRIAFPQPDADTINRIQLTRQQDRISLTTRDAPIAVVLGMIAEQHGLNVVAGEEVTQKISVTLNNVKLEDALNAILAVNGYTWSRQQDIILVSSISSDKKSSPAIQGRQVRVFTLNYILAADADRVIKGLLSPVGQSFTNTTSSTEQRQTHEQIIVEDLPSYLDRIAAYLAQVDVLPRQVVIEARVLQVTLKNNCKHGVDFDQLLRVNNSSINLTTVGLAGASSPAAAMTVGGGDLVSLIDLLQSTTDAKTLASPKVAVLNGQEARIQVGGKLGYFLTTTTQTSTLQSVDFLEFGVILRVTPIITESGQVLIKVMPQVSTGRINPITKLPESETTEVETKVMLNDGQAIVIGGLIKETDNTNQNKIPWLGDIKYLGWLFQSNDAIRERNEIIVTILPRISHGVLGANCGEQAEVDRTMTPLLDPALNRIDRTNWEPRPRTATDGTCAEPVTVAGPGTNCDPATCVPVPQQLPGTTQPVIQQPAVQNTMNPIVPATVPSQPVPQYQLPPTVPTLPMSPGIQQSSYQIPNSTQPQSSTAGQPRAAMFSPPPLQR